jgi:Big-like domain-containing protein
MLRVLALLGLALAAGGAVKGSGATFTASSANAANTFSTAADWVAPAVTITSPADGSSTNDTTPTLSGAAGNATGDNTTVTVNIYSGTSATGTPVLTRNVTRSGATWSTTATALAVGTYTAQATQTDTAGNTGKDASTFTVDTTKPTAVQFSADNKTGGTAGKPEAGDTLVYTFSEAMAPASILSGWSGSSTSVTVRFTNSANNDTITVLSGTTTLHLGSVATAGNFVTGTVNFTGSTMVRSADGKSITVTLGTTTGTTRTVTGTNMTWTPDVAATDLAGNAVSTTAYVENAGNTDF